MARRARRAEGQHVTDPAPRSSRHLPTRVALTSLDIGPFFGEEHRALVTHLRSVVESLVDQSSHDAAGVASQLGSDHQLYRYLVPHESGGAASDTPTDIDVRSLVLIREALGYASPLGDAIFAVQGLGSYPLALFGTAEQKSGIASLISGERITAFALTEPEAGSDVASLRTEARRDGDSWVLDGDKTLISNATIADSFVVFANIDPSLGRKGITAFVVPRDTAGLHIEQQPMNGDHPIGSLAFRGCRLPQGARLGPDGGGFRAAMQTLETFRISVGAAACGMAAAAA